MKRDEQRQSWRRLSLQSTAATRLTAYMYCKVGDSGPDENPDLPFGDKLLSRVFQGQATELS